MSWSSANAANAARVGKKGRQSKRELSSPEEPIFKQRIRRLDLTDALFDVNLQPKLAFYNLLEDLQLAAFGASRGGDGNSQ